MGVTTALFIFVLVQSILNSDATGYTYLDEAGAFYKIRLFDETWFDAKTRCEEDGAALFYPKNEDEAREVLAFWNKTASYLCCMHIGISDLQEKGHFVTIDGQPINDVYNNWDTDEPNHILEDEHCLTIRRDGKLNDHNCYNRYPSICRKTIEDGNYKPSRPNKTATPVTTSSRGKTPHIDGTNEPSIPKAEKTTTDTQSTKTTPLTTAVLVIFFLLLVAVGVVVVSRYKEQFLNCSFIQNIRARRRPTWQMFDKQNSVLISE